MLSYHTYPIARSRFDASTRADGHPCGCFYAFAEWSCATRFAWFGIWKSRRSHRDRGGGAAPKSGTCWAAPQLYGGHLGFCRKKRPALWCNPLPLLDVWHIPFDSPEVLAEKLSALLGYRELRKKMGKNAANYAKEYAWEKIAAKIIEVYEEVQGK